jgi:uncharacterized protein YegP (UPF0339 family)
MGRVLTLEVFQGGDGQWFNRIRWANGQRYMTSEGYTRKATALRMASRFLKRSLAAIVIRVIE